MKLTNIKYIYLSSIIALISFISSCGFHLRGNIDLPASYQNIFIIDKGATDISVLLKQSLINNQVTVLDSAENATSIITLFTQNISRRPIAVRGKEVKEYEVQLNVSFAVQDANGKQRGDSQHISSIRRYSFNNNQVLGSNNEEQILINEMKDDIVRQILRRLATIN